MFHHLNHNSKFPSERNLLLQAGNGPGDSGLVLSTDAKPRLKWNPELHERFVEAVNQLGGADKATPKTVMRLMGIPGLTLYHLKSHLQKYRLCKTQQAQTIGRTAKNVIGPTAAPDRASEDSQFLVKNINLGHHSNKTVQVDEALQMQMEVQMRLHEQMEVQRHLQMRIEIQGKYLQSVLEKAHSALEKQNSSYAGLGAAKVQFSELVSKFSNEYLNSEILGLGETHGVDKLQCHSGEFRDYSMDSCLTSCEATQKGQEIHNNNMILRGYHSNLPPSTKVNQEDCRPEHIKFGWCEELDGPAMFTQSRVNGSEHLALPDTGDASILSISITNRRERVERSKNSEKNCRIRDEYTSNLERTSYKRNAGQQDSSKKLNGFGLPNIATQLDLNAYDENNASQNCREIDLNNFSWT
ncbi:Myb family transcription factor APL [Platanthera guangdongensis]|uniref:Myb family transcription factor APL n=1 Tax=Platanthera guangdongensis TaxID=2320717 RepID=A0ABR2LVA7_9ASPA